MPRPPSQQGWFVPWAPRLTCCLKQYFLRAGRLLEGLGAQTGQPRTDSGPLSRPTVEGKHGPCPRTPSLGPQVPMHSARPCVSVLTAGH